MPIRTSETAIRTAHLRSLIPGKIVLSVFADGTERLNSRQILILIIDSIHARMGLVAHPSVSLYEHDGGCPLVRFCKAGYHGRLSLKMTLEPLLTFRGALRSVHVSIVPVLAKSARSDKKVLPLLSIFSVHDD